MVLTKKCLVCGKLILDRRTYCSYSCKFKHERTGKISPNFKTGSYISGGYRHIISKGHPYASWDGYVLEHRRVMELKLHRYLLSNEIVHHINHNRLDNRIENLMLLNKSQHKKLHPEGNKYWLGKKHTEETKKKMSISAKKAGTGKWIRKHKLNESDNRI
jgi:hypothetical protein